MKDYFHGEAIDWDEKIERCYWRRIGFVIFAAMVLAMLLYPLISRADPMYRVSDGRVTITIYNEKCAIKTISNLPFRATWEEGGKKFEGCVGPWTIHEIAVAYFDDGSVAVIPLGALQKVTGA